MIAPTASAQAWPHLPRRGYERKLAAALAEASATVALMGAAGVGKTELAGAIAGTFAGATWICGMPSAQSIPLGALALVASVEDTREPVEVADAWRQTWSGADSVVVVDDAQWLDDASASVIRRFVAVRPRPRLLVVVRQGVETAAELAQVLDGPEVTTVLVEAFDESETTALVQAHIGGALDPASARRVWETTAGNPLYLRYLLEGAQMAGALWQSDGVWRLNEDIEITPELSVLIQTQVRQAGPGVARLLQCLAIAEPLDAELIGILGCAESVARARSRRLVVTDAAGDTYLAHPIVGEVVRGDSGLLRARAVRGELVDAFGQVKQLSRLRRIVRAELSIDSACGLPAHELTAAAEDALRLGNRGLAEKLARAGVAGGGGFPAVAVHARALSRLGRGPEAEKALAAIDPDQLPEVALASWLLARVTNLFFAMCEPERALSVFWRYRARVENPYLALPLDNCEAGLGLYLGETERALEVALEALDSTFATPWSDVAAGWVGSAAMAFKGWADQIGRVADRGVAAGASTESALRFTSGHYGVEGCLYGGYLAEAQTRAAQLADLAVGEAFTTALAGLSTARVLAARGELAAAERELRSALPHLNMGDKAGWRSGVLIELSRVSALQGRPSPELVDEADAGCGANQVVLRPGLEVARAWTEAAQGRMRQAQQTALSSAKYSASFGLWSFEAASLHIATRFGVRGNGTRLVELAGVVEGPMIEAMAAHAVALDAEDPARLRAAARQFAELGFPIEGADALAHAAIFLVAEGQGREAGWLRTELAAVRARHDGVRTPAVDHALAPLPLTTRERQVAGLVADGAGNREIADRLGLSVRTVEGHVMRACEKLSVSGRQGLVEALGGRDASAGS